MSYPDVWDGDRGLGEIGGQDYFSFAWKTLEDQAGVVDRDSGTKNRS